MGYAIVGYFDEKTSKKIKKIWRILSDNSVDDYLINSENDPHFKFYMCDEIGNDINKIKNAISKIVTNNNELKLHFKKFGFYPNKEKPFITLDIADNSSVIQLFNEIHAAFNKCTDQNYANYFSQNIWKPDIQLTTSIDSRILSTAIEILNDVDLPFDGYLCSIGLIEFHPAKQVFRIPFGS